MPFAATCAWKTPYTSAVHREVRTRIEIAYKRHPMTEDFLANKAKRYMQYLSLELPGRSVGTQGNRAATTFFADTVSSFGFLTDDPEFDCMDWTQEGATLVVGDELFLVHPSPYTLGCQARAPMSVMS